MSISPKKMQMAKTPHSSQDVHYEQVYKHINVESREKREPSHTVGANVSGAATTENSTEVPHKTKNSFYLI